MVTHTRYSLAFLKRALCSEKTLVRSHWKNQHKFLSAAVLVKIGESKHGRRSASIDSVPTRNISFSQSGEPAYLGVKIVVAHPVVNQLMMTA